MIERTFAAFPVGLKKNDYEKTGKKLAAFPVDILDKKDYEQIGKHLAATPVDIIAIKTKSN